MYIIDNVEDTAGIYTGKTVLVSHLPRFSFGRRNSAPSDHSGLSSTPRLLEDRKDFDRKASISEHHQYYRRTMIECQGYQSPSDSFLLSPLLGLAPMLHLMNAAKTRNPALYMGFTSLRPSLSLWASFLKGTLHR